jgi:hypothetical protein
VLALEPVRFPALAGDAQRLEGGLPEQRQPPGLVPQLGDLAPDVGWLPAAPLLKDRSDRLSVSLVVLRAVLGLDVDFLSPPSPRVVATEDRLPSGVRLCAFDMEQDRIRVPGDCSPGDRLGGRPRRNQIAILLERRRVGSQIFRREVQECREPAASWIMIAPSVAL